MLEKSIRFGQQNFFYVKNDESDGTYDYTGFMTQQGAILIARYTKDGDNALYWVGTGDFDTIWAAKATKNYVYPNELDLPRV